MNHDYAEIEVEILKVSPGAVLVYDGFKEVWIPKSLIENGGDITTDCEGELVELFVMEWFAYKEDLI